MPPPQYTRQRRLIMQLVMVILLGGTLALAAWVRQARVGPSGVPLPRSGAAGALKLRMPDWDLKEVKGISEGHLSSPAIVRAVEPVPPGSTVGRVLEVWQEDVSRDVLPQKYLIDTFRLPADLDVSPIKMLGRQGVFAQVSPTAAQTRPTSVASTESQIFACTVLRPGLAVTVRLRVGGRPADEHDAALVRQVAKTLQLLDINQGSRLGLTAAKTAFD